MESIQESDRLLKATKNLQMVTVLTSSSTLICCALPAALVAFGAAATLTSLVSAVPQLIWLSEHKALVFGLAMGMLLLAGYAQWYARRLPCPADLALAAQCQKMRRQGWVIYALSVCLFLIGGFFAFIAPSLID